MTQTAKKASATLGGVPLAATRGVAWRFVTGVQPYTTIFEVHKSNWPKLQEQIGQPLTLKIVDSRGVESTINQVYILHLAPSGAPPRVAFVVADKRWRWPYRLVVRDFNMPRKTGDRTAKQPVPVETQVVVDEYDYLAYSLQGEEGTRWTAQAAVEEVLRILELEGAPAGGFEIESFPIKDTSGGNNTATFTLQGVSLRDAGDLALARLLSYVPGATVYVRADGRTVVIDSTDVDATDKHFHTLPVSTYSGEKAVWIDRKKIRPEKVVVHYQREVEVLLEYEDDYSGSTRPQPARSRSYIENVCPTVDTTTTVREFDPEINKTVEKANLPPGTWVRMDALLEAWNDDRPEGSLPWTFDTLKIHWLVGDLEGVLGARGQDLDEDANIAMRVQAIRQHFRQTFRINRRYTGRTRSLRAVRVGVLDPISGARAPAAVWGQACIIPTTKGKYMASRSTDELDKSKVYRNVDYLAPARNGDLQIIDTPPGPTRVSIIDQDLGVFRLEWVVSPYGTDESFIPCKLVNNQNFDGIAVTRDLSQQDDEPMGPGLIVEGGSNGVFLADSLEYSIIVTLVPNAPNNARQFHRVEVEPSEVASLFRREFGIKDGEGPTLEIFVPPGELTARFAIEDEDEGGRSVQELFGLLNAPNDPEAGVEGPEIPGYVLCNEERELQPHAVSAAAELLTAFADNMQGTIVTRVPDGGLKLVGNMNSATVRVAAAPSGKVDAVHAFPGQSQPISRLALMPESTRQLVLGIVPFTE